jgi:hypothetical protein
MLSRSKDIGERVYLPHCYTSITLPYHWPLYEYKGIQSLKPGPATYIYLFDVGGAGNPKRQLDTEAEKRGKRALPLASLELSRSGCELVQPRRNVTGRAPSG